MSPYAPSPPSAPRCPATSTARSTSCAPPHSIGAAGDQSRGQPLLVIHCLLLSGRADEAVAVTAAAPRRRHATDTPATCRPSPRWMAGEPGELLALGRTSVDIPAVTSRDEFVRRTLVAAMLASTGRRDEVHRLVDGSARSPSDRSTPGTPCSTPSPGRCAPSSTTTKAPRRAADRRRGGRPCRQPDPRPAPAPVPAPGLRARCRHSTPVGRRRRWARPTSRPGRRAGGWSTSAPVHQPDADRPRSRRRCSPPSRCRGRSSWPPDCTPHRHPDGARLAEWLVRPGPGAGARRAAPPRRRRGDAVGRAADRPARPPAGDADSAARDLGPRAAAGRLRRRRRHRARTATSSGPHAARAARRPRHAQPGTRHRPALARPRRRATARGTSG